MTFKSLLSKRLTQAKTLVLSLLLTQQVHGQDRVMLADISQLQWQHRIIIINADESADGILQRLEQFQTELDDRDVLWFVLSGEKSQSNYPGALKSGLVKAWREQYELPPNHVILIGKDGGLKSRYFGLEIGLLFSDIDAMPMRQSEMKQ